MEYLSYFFLVWFVLFVSLSALIAFIVVVDRLIRAYRNVAVDEYAIVRENSTLIQSSITL
jgi:hypothetical protein